MRLSTLVASGLCVLSSAGLTSPADTAKNDFIVIEAENFVSQHLNEKRSWLKFSSDTPQHNHVDSDGNHAEGASNGQYIEVLPDTRSNHNETLLRGENFSDRAGEMAVLSYKVYVNNPGTYFVWARAYSTGSEDNGIHFGIDGTWPETGQRLQLCKNKHRWTWSSAQRTKKNHCGIPNTIMLNLPHRGTHKLMVSMREDGFELDKILLTQDKNYRPTGIDLPENTKETNSLALKNYLKPVTDYNRTLHAIQDFRTDDTGGVPLYHHKAQKALAIDATKNEYRDKYALADYTVDGKQAGTWTLTLVTLTEIDGESRYQVLLNNEVIGSFENPKSQVDFQEAYFTINNVKLMAGDTIKVASMAVTNGEIPENGGTAYARGRWRAVVLNANY